MEMIKKNSVKSGGPGILSPPPKKQVPKGKHSVVVETIRRTHVPTFPTFKILLMLNCPNQRGGGTGTLWEGRIWMIFIGKCRFFTPKKNSGAGSKNHFASVKVMLFPSSRFLYRFYKKFTTLWTCAVKKRAKFEPWRAAAAVLGLFFAFLRDFRGFSRPLP